MFSPNQIYYWTLISVTLILFLKLFVDISGLRKQKIRFSKLKLSLIYGATFYLLVIFIMFGYDYLIKLKLDSFDIDGDGILSDLESTPEALAFLYLSVDDLARNNTPITAFFVTPVITLSVLFLASITSFIRNMLVKAT
jgi:hypothetical protein